MASEVKTFDRQAAIAEAERFAATGFAAELEHISRRSQLKIANSRAQLSKRGILLSGHAVSETARINAERITSLLQLRLNLLLEGYELHGVALDEELTQQTINGLLDQQSTLIKQTVQALNSDVVGSRGLVKIEDYSRMVAQQVSVSPAAIRTQIERRRLTLLKKEAQRHSVNNVYHVSGHNARVNVNSTDQSVNSVTISSDEIFVALRQEVERQVPQGDEQKAILEKLDALNSAQNTPTFGKRYAEFVSVAANHMTVIGPFIPALTELLNRVLS